MIYICSLNLLNLNKVSCTCLTIYICFLNTYVATSQFIEKAAVRAYTEGIKTRNERET